jgi:hypothetical protein
VVGFGVNGISTDDVGPQFLQIRNITLALLGIRKRVDVVIVGFGGAIGSVFLCRSTLVPV